jgi:pyrroloquinoline quinone (PQQ) biosynthesis protein C
MATLVDTYATAVSQSPAFALGVLAAYEVQGSAIADTKGEGLRSRYAMSAADTTFWDAHVELEADHAAWTIEALASLSDAELDEAFAGAEASAAAWWGFLDEREAANTAPCLA